MSRCWQCRRTVPSPATVCAACGQRDPGRGMAWAAAVVLVLFGLLFAGAGAQYLAGPTGGPTSVLPPEIRVVDRWGLGLYGVGKAAVVSDTLATDAGMTWVAEALRGGTAERRFVRVYLFTDDQRARVPPARGGLGPERPEEWAEADILGLYRRNERTGVEELSYAPRGFSPEPLRLLEW